MTTPINTSFYGDQVRWFVGTIVDNDDSPTTVLLTRVKVKAFGIHDNIPEDKLPWASVVLPTTEGGTGRGRGAALDIGAQVFGIFLDGANSQYPLVLGSIPFAFTSWEEVNQFTGPGTYSTQNGQAVTQSGTPRETFSGSQSGPAIDPSVAALRTYEFFRTRGYSDAQARGIYGNLSHESGGFRQDVVSLSVGTDLDGNSYGIAQWRGERYQGLITFARERRIPPGQLSTQLAYVAYELDTYAYLGKAGLLRCTTAAQAAVHFMRKYERPANEPGGGFSIYGDPVWTTTGAGTIRKKYGEDDRINRAVNTNFEATTPSGNVS